MAGEGEVAEEEACAGTGAGEDVVEEDVFCACSLCARRTWMRPVTYSRTEIRISMPGRTDHESVRNPMSKEMLVIRTDYQCIRQHGRKTSQQPTESTSNIDDFDILH